jgi:hypothetical protein
MMATLEDEDAQRRGIINVGYEVGDNPLPFEYEFVWREMHKLKCIPIRVVLAHFCSTNASLMNALDLFIHLSTPFFQVRL